MMQAALKPIQSCAMALPHSGDAEKTAVLECHSWHSKMLDSLLKQVAEQPLEWLYLLANPDVLDQPEWVQLLSALRDQSSVKFAVFVVDDGVVITPDLRSRMDLMALGLSGKQQDAFWWAEFDIAHYKPTPDWFGPRNWANPEMWDRYRW